MSNIVKVTAPTIGRHIITSAETDVQLVAEWCDGYDGHTRRAYDRIGPKFLEALGTPLRAAVIHDYRTAIQKLTTLGDGSEASRSTKATYTAAVKSLLTFAHETGYLPINAAPFLKLAKHERDLALRIMSEAQVQALIAAAAAGRDRLMIEVGYYGGLRVSEIVALKWSGVLERDGGMLQLASLRGKGGKIREVLLPPGVSQRLTAYHCAGASASTAVFPNWRGQPMTERSALRIIKQAAADAGLPNADRISPHWLRHAHISHALDHGAPVSLVSQSVGHTDLKTTSIYAHAKPGDSSGLYLRES